MRLPSVISSIVKNALQFVAHMGTEGLMYLPQTSSDTAKIDYYVNASHSNDEKNQIAHAGLVVFLNANPVTWSSMSLELVTTSTMEDKYVAINTNIGRAIFVERMITELNIYPKLTMQLKEDHTPAIRSLHSLI